MDSQMSFEIDGHMVGVQVGKSSWPTYQPILFYSHVGIHVNIIMDHHLVTTQ